MSSDSISTGSTLGQFGLRSIDARTEEFLRLSKKKQIRRGCACAAISTAITVTVVVSMLLVKEYTINSEIQPQNKLSFKQTWLGLNQSDITEFNENYLKSQLNIDGATLKLLPILLKVLKQFKYFGDINNEPEEPVYHKKTEHHQNNIYDFRNWLKYPFSRLYSVEYKTTPVMYYRNPTQTIEHFAKLRKIRDYERVLKYVDKMISKKVGSSISIIKRELAQTGETTKLSATPINITTKKLKSNTNEKRIERFYKCPKNLAELLTKLISRIPKLLPHIGPNKTQPIFSKSKNTLKIMHLNNSTNKNYKDTYRRNKDDKNTRNNDLFTTDKTCYPKPNILIKNHHIKEYHHKNFNTVSRVNHLPNESEMETWHHDVANKVIGTLDKTSTVQNFIGGTSKYYAQKSITIPMTKGTPKRKESTGEVNKGDIFKIKGFQIERNNFDSLDAHSLESVRSKMIPIERQILITKNKFSEAKLPDYQPRIDYPSNIKGLSKNYLKNVIKHKNHLKDMLLKLSSITSGVKSNNENSVEVITLERRHNMRTSEEREDNIRKHSNNYTFKKIEKNVNDDKIHKQPVIRKKSYLIYNNTSNKNSAKIDILKCKDNWESDKKSSTASIKEKNAKILNHTGVQINNSISVSDNKATLLNKKFKKSNKHAKNSYSASEFKPNDEFVEYDIDKMIEQDMEEENIIKQIELEMEKYPKYSMMDLIQSKLKKMPTESVVTEIPKPETPRSMLPQTKPIYLEIQRTSWKHEEMQDFDTNVANNLFDLPVV